MSYSNNQNDRFQVIMDKLESIERKQSILMTKDSQKFVVDVDQLAGILKVSSATIHKWRNDGLIKYSLIGKKLFFTMSDVFDFLSRHQVPLKKK